MRSRFIHILRSLLVLGALIFGLLAPRADAAWVSGYYRNNGTYVQGHYRSNPNGLRYDNYSYEVGQPLFNSSYGMYSTYRWNTPAWSWQDDYWTGLDSYRSSLSDYGDYRSYGTSLYDYDSLPDDYNYDYDYGYTSNLFDY